MAATGWQRRGASETSPVCARTRSVRYRGQECPRPCASANRLSQVAIPNGMHTEYTYDTSGRQDSIHHKDGSTVKQRFDYTFENGGNITQIDHEDGSYWAYDYDGRDRLIEAERYDSTPTLLHRYAYTYDDGDNMLTKAVYDPSGPTTVTSTFTYNDANEQTNMNDGTTSIDMTYDEWGRLVEKDDGAHTATYAYRYGSKLYSVTSDFPGEGNVTYESGGDGKRRSRIDGANETWYNWSAGWTVLSEEDDADGGSGVLIRTYLGRNTAHVDGSSPASGDWKYSTCDRIASLRGSWAEDKTIYASAEYEPYGGIYSASGYIGELSRRFTEHDWDETSQLAFAPHRYYAPQTGRWLTRDPLGMIDGPNTYAYVGLNPIDNYDSLGLKRDGVNDEQCRPCTDKIRNGKKKACSKESLDRITDRSRRRCIKKKCSKGRINCSFACKSDSGGIGVDKKDYITICVNQLNEHKPGPRGVSGLNDEYYLGNVILHEFAHTCGWEHGGGQGVPNPSDYTPGDYDPSDPESKPPY